MNWFRKASSLANLIGSFVIGMRQIRTSIIELLLTGVCATALLGQTAPPPSPQTDISQTQQIELLRAQMQQMRVDFERQMNTMEERLKLLQSNLPSHPSTSEVPTMPLAGQAESQSATKAENDAAAKQAAVAVVRAVSGTEVRDASSEKAERNEKGIEAGKTPLYENVNDEQNLAIQQAKAFEFHGYLRSGTGVNGRGGQQVYFEAPGAPAKYRLGNETDTYGEFVLVNNWVNVRQVKDQAWFHTEILVSADTTETAQGDATDTLNLREAFVRGGNLFTSHPNWRFWAGERYYRRWNIDQIDWYMQDMSGYGGGIEDVSVAGPLKISFAYLAGAIHNDQLSQNYLLKNTFDLDWYGLKGLHGGIGGRFYFAAAKGGQAAKTSNNQPSSSLPGSHGYGIEVGHNVTHLLGGNDRTVVQWATGEASNFSTVAITPEPWIRHATGLRIENQILIQPHDPDERFSIFGTLAYQLYHSFNAANTTDSWVSFGARPQLYLTNHLNLALDAGTDHIIQGTGNYSGWLRKVTFAPEIGAGRGYYSRPSVRVFVTYANWTKGFKGQVACPAFCNAQQGVTAGLQFENWW